MADRPANPDPDRNSETGHKADLEQGAGTEDRPDPAIAFAETVMQFAPSSPGEVNVPAIPPDQTGQTPVWDTPASDDDRHHGGREDPHAPET